MAPTIGQHTLYASSGYVESFPMDDIAGNGDHLGAIGAHA